ncbi:hypothetical protein VE04_03852 [Pseudogymnoascus sp. 24MN13]|nr:hypothetical protein VE04_03852 [Pseudogymnoascus sp. 24MN13]
MSDNLSIANLPDQRWKISLPPPELLHSPPGTSHEIESILESSIEQLQALFAYEARLEWQQQLAEERNRLELQRAAAERSEREFTATKGKLQRQQQLPAEEDNLKQGELSVETSGLAVENPLGHRQNDSASANKSKGKGKNKQEPQNLPMVNSHPTSSRSGFGNDSGDQLNVIAPPLQTQGHISTSTPKKPAAPAESLALAIVSPPVRETLQGSRSVFRRSPPAYAESSSAAAARLPASTKGSLTLVGSPPSDIGSSSSPKEPIKPWYLIQKYFGVYSKDCDFNFNRDLMATQMLSRRSPKGHNSEPPPWKAEDTKPCSKNALSRSKIESTVPNLHAVLGFHIIKLTSTQCWHDDPDLRETIRCALNAGWRRCYKCNALVEHAQGCSHMTCHCKAQFCYTCGLKWKTCTCTEIELEAYLISAHWRRETGASQAQIRQAAFAALDREVRADQTEHANELREVLNLLENAEERTPAQRAAEDRAFEVVAEREAAQDRSRDFEAKLQMLREEMDLVHSIQQIANFDRFEAENKALEDEAKEELAQLDKIFNALRHEVEDRERAKYVNGTVKAAEISKAEQLRVGHQTDMKWFEEVAKVRDSLLMQMTVDEYSV